MTALSAGYSHPLSAGYSHLVVQQPLSVALFELSVTALINSNNGSGVPDSWGTLGPTWLLWVLLSTLGVSLGTLFWRFLGLLGLSEAS